jgi:hypothetical protein
MEQKTKLKNECNKERDKDNPYEIWKSVDGTWEWRVLKKWQMDDDKPFARWFCAVKSPMTYGGFDIGDVYVKDIRENAIKVWSEKEGDIQKDWVDEHIEIIGGNAETQKALIEKIKEELKRRNK